MAMYRATKTGFFDNELRVPGTDSALIVTPKKLSEVPSWMEEVTPPSKKKKPPVKKTRDGEDKPVATDGDEDEGDTSPSLDDDKTEFKGPVEEI